MYHTIDEGKAKVKVPKEEKISKDLPVFYNPIMQTNRDISILLLNILDKKKMQIALPLAGSGVRGVRFMLESSKGIIESLVFNDKSKDAVKLINQNLKLNKIKSKKVEVFNKDANKFMVESKGYDYIDIDPFGSPNKFLNNAIERLSRRGVLAVTATDTACLCGTYVKACIRKYWAYPVNGSIMHETGLRILIRKVQLVAAQFDKALTPVFSYFKDHYFRVFFVCDKGKLKVDAILKQHGMLDTVGPMWLGRLFDPTLAGKMYKIAEDKELRKFLEMIKNESKIDTVGFFDVHAMCKKHKVAQVPSFEDLMKKIKKKGFKVSRTHFSKSSIRSDMSYGRLVKLIKA